MGSTLTVCLINLNYISRKGYCKFHCIVNVSKTTFFLFLQFYRMNFTPYPISEADYVLVEIMHDNTFIVSSREYGGQKWGDSNMMKISFTVREAGTYKISVLARGTPIKGSPFTKTFLPGNTVALLFK